MIDLTDFAVRVNIMVALGLIVFLLVLIFFAKFPTEKPSKKKRK